MSAFEDWWKKQRGDMIYLRKDDMHEAFNAGMTRAAEILEDNKKKQAGICCDNCGCVAMAYSASDILIARDGIT